MSIINRWGADRVQQGFFKRQIEYRKTLQKLVFGEGAKVIAENSQHFKSVNAVRSMEDLTNMVLARYIRPVLLEDGIILPQIVGINTKERQVAIISYAPVLKAFNGKVAGLVDVLMKILGDKGCSDFCAFVTGSRGGDLGNMAAVAAYDIGEKGMLTRAFARKGKSAIAEFDMPLSRFEEMFSRTFDSDIWVSDEVWKEDQN